MPLVRIDLLEGKNAAYREGVSEAVYRSLVDVGVPENDRFQIIAEHRDRRNFVFDPSYLGIERSDNLIMIQITWNDGRTLDQKKTLYRNITDRLGESLGVRPQDVLINLVEVRKENWCFGDGLATYAP